MASRGETGTKAKPLPRGGRKKVLEQLELHPGFSIGWIASGVDMTVKDVERILKDLKSKGQVIEFDGDWALVEDAPTVSHKEWEVLRKHGHPCGRCGRSLGRDEEVLTIWGFNPWLCGLCAGQIQERNRARAIKALPPFFQDHPEVFEGEDFDTETFQEFLNFISLAESDSDWWIELEGRTWIVQLAGALGEGDCDVQLQRKRDGSWTAKSVNRPT
jgi:hypothetical protein